MHAFDVLGDPIRRRILEIVAEGEVPAGEVARVVREEFGISQPAVSQHLRVLRENGFASARAEGARRLYSVDARGVRDAHQWLSGFERFWIPRMAALDTELARGLRGRRHVMHEAGSGEDSRPLGSEAAAAVDTEGETDG